MKEISHIAFNALASLGSGQLIPQSEVILVLSQVAYAIAPEGSTGNVEGGVDKFREFETVRFVANARTLRAISDSLSHEADRIETDVLEAAAKSLVDCGPQTKSSAP